MIKSQPASPISSSPVRSSSGKIRVRTACGGALLLLTMLNFPLLSGCTPVPGDSENPAEAVTIEKEEPKVETKIYNEGRRLPTSELEEANTKWFFHCLTGISTTNEMTKEGASDKVITITVASIRIGLSLPIVMYMPYQARAQLVEHEQGHVDICKRVYETADAQARTCGQELLGKTFSGKGATVEEARRNALRVAGESFCRCYTDKTVDVANAVSDIYDEITDHSKNRTIKSSQAVEQAFARYEGKK